MGCCKIQNKKNERDRKPTDVSESEPMHRSPFYNLMSSHSDNFLDDYEVAKIIGEGGYGQVKEVVEKSTGFKRAVKSIHTKFMNKSELENIFQEVNILTSLDHPGVIKIFQVYREQNFVHIVTDICTGGELLQRITKLKRFSENIAAKYMFDIVSVVKYLHESSVMHRDLKPDNIMFEDSSETARLKLIDFGTALKFNKKALYDTLAGTPYYIAPEVISGVYTEKCDIWSLGIILYIMLTGVPPFTGNTNSEIYKKILNDSPNMDLKPFDKVSKSAKALLKKMLIKDPVKRISINDLFYDPWIRTRSNELVPDRTLSRISMKNLITFKKMNVFQSCIYLFMSQCFATAHELKHIRKLFERFDVNGDGRLSVEEINKGLSDYSGEFRVKADEIMENCDTDKNGFIDYSEFLTAVCSKNLELTKKQLKIAFDAIDTDGSGKLSKLEIKKALAGMNSDRSIFDLIRDIDKNGDGEIDLDEFTQAILLSEISKAS